jgi:dihydroxyacid dehydratase/phosphogluconate dehydratase
MGMSLPYSSTMAAEDAEKADSAEKIGFCLGGGDSETVIAPPDSNS